MSDDINESRLIRIAKAVAAKFGPYSLTNSMGKMNAAKNPRTSEDRLRELAEDENEYVRMAVAQNLSTPQDALMMLANDEVLGVREAVLQNPSARALV